jgi:hypothetical protein
MPGPFDVEPNRVDGLGAAFASFINDLLVAEVSRAGILGFQLDINAQTNTADGGVDAALSSSNGTDWLPIGSSVWQFKSSDLGPAECKKELSGAGFVHDGMREGATYVLVLGKPLVEKTKQNRLKALQEVAENLGLDRDAIRVYDGNQLARWISTLPALALDKRLNGPGFAVLDFERWSNSTEHRERWVACPSRGKMELAVKEVALGTLPNYRLEGGSGLGKTRLVMEALRSTDARELVLYAPRAEQLQTETLTFLGNAGRSSILVVDNCSRAYHQSIAEQLDTSRVRLLTIGVDAEERLTKTPLHQLPPAEPREIDSILQENVPGLWSEATRVVQENSFGNVRTALLLAARLVETGQQNVTELLQENDFRNLIRTLLPEHIDFFSCAVLALLERVGWDRDRRNQLEILCSFADLTPEQAETTAQQLGTAGLLNRQGRYRSLAPQPLAVFLAAAAWEQFGDRILDELAPKCDPEMLSALFHRAADLGRFPPVREVLGRLLSKEGQFGSLAGIEGSNAEFLVQLAIVSPDETMIHLAELFEVEPLEAIRQQTESRRSLITALEKLVWHSKHFKRAGDCLLRLALAENETWANNATGVWSALFGVRLPSTAASPNQRIEYLRGHAASHLPETRLLVANATAGVLHPHESVMVSGELQGGTIVEPRGSARSVEETCEYSISLLNVLDTLSRDEVDSVAEAAVKGLIDSLYSLIDTPRVGERLADIVASFSGDHLRQLRKALEAILNRHNEGPQALELQSLKARLPAIETIERLHDLVSSQPWNWRDDQKVQELISVIDAAVSDGSIGKVGEWLQQEQLPSAWRLGNAFGARNDRESFVGLFELAAQSNASMIAGFLAAVEDLKPGAFDRLLESAKGRKLPESTRLFLTTASPQSVMALRRLIDLSRTVSVSDAARQTVHWQENLNSDDASTLIEDWMSRIGSDHDYAAVVDWVHLLTSQSGTLPPELFDLTSRLLHRRLDYPNIGNQRYSWCQLAAVLIPYFPDDIAQTILNLVSRNELLLMDTDDEAAILRNVCAISPSKTWALIAGQIEQGNWRVSLAVAGWLAGSVPTSTIQTWIGGVEGRAELVARIAPAGDERPSELAILLLTLYPENQKIADSLAAQFQRGGWIGSWSGRLEIQISQLNGWRNDAELPIAVRSWAAKMIEYLQREKSAALESEAEE